MGTWHCKKSASKQCLQGFVRWGFAPIIFSRRSPHTRHPPSPSSSGGEEDAKEETDDEGQKEAAEKEASDGEEMADGDGDFVPSDVDEDLLRIGDETEDPNPEFDTGPLDSGPVEDAEEVPDRDEVTVHGRVWCKSICMNDSRCRKARKQMSLRNLPVTFDTTELDIFEELMPFSWGELCDHVSDVAGSFKDTNKYTEDNLRAWMGITLGAAQYRPGTDLWATKRTGLLSAPNFGRFLSKDKYRRITRYLSGMGGGLTHLKC